MAGKSEEMSENYVQSLSSIFKESMDRFNMIINSDKPMNSPDMQIDIKKTMKLLEQATRLISLSDLFSKNEDIEEVATNDLQYFLAPALLGSLSLKLTTGDRKDIVDVAEIYFKDFLNRCSEYGLTNSYQDKRKNNNEERTVENTSFGPLAAAMDTRTKKIHRFKEQKRLKFLIEDLKKSMEDENVDEVIKRKYFLTIIELFIHDAIDELDSIQMEKPIIEMRAKLKTEDKPQLKRPPTSSLQPVIITRDEVQKAVFGAGYPSLPIMTVQEFYDKRVADGIFPGPDKKRPGAPMSLLEAAVGGESLGNQEENEKEQTENLIDIDDDENLARMRAKDEFKDDHRRGWGNRMNRS